MDFTLCTFSGKEIGCSVQSSGVTGVCRSHPYRVSHKGGNVFQENLSLRKYTGFVRTNAHPPLLFSINSLRFSLFSKHTSGTVSLRLGSRYSLDTHGPITEVLGKGVETARGKL